MQRPPNHVLASLWADYAAAPTLTNRNRVVEGYLWLPEVIAKSLVKRMPKADIEEFVSAGHVGLIEAVDRFDPTRGVLFVTLATLRVRGAMLDYARSIDTVNRPTRQRYKRWHAAADRLRGQLQREPYREEVEAVLGLQSGEWDASLRDANDFLLPLSAYRMPDDSGPIELPDPRVVDVGHECDAVDEFEHLLTSDALDPLDVRVLRMKFQDDRLHREIEATLGCSKGHVSNMISRARRKLKLKLLEAA